MASREARERAIYEAAKLVRSGSLFVRRATASPQEPAERFVPLSVRTGGPQKKLSWQVSLLRERIALVLAPWLSGRRLH